MVAAMDVFTKLFADAEFGAATGVLAQHRVYI
jgi:hypothetical protein